MLGETFHSRCVCHITSVDIPYHSNHNVSNIRCPLERSHLGVFIWLWWKRGLIVVTCSYICNGCMPVRAVCKTSLPTSKRGALALAFLVRAPASRPGIPGSRPAQSKNELRWCGPGGVTHIQLVFFLIKYFFI